MSEGALYPSHSRRALWFARLLWLLVGCAWIGGGAEVSGAALAVRPGAGPLKWISSDAALPDLADRAPDPSPRTHDTSGGAPALAPAEHNQPAPASQPLQRMDVDGAVCPPAMERAPSRAPPRRR